MSLAGLTSYGVDSDDEGQSDDDDERRDESESEDSDDDLRRSIKSKREAWRRKKHENSKKCRQLCLSQSLWE